MIMWKFISQKTLSNYPKQDNNKVGSVALIIIETQLQFIEYFQLSYLKLEFSKTSKSVVMHLQVKQKFQSNVDNVQSSYI